MSAFLSVGALSIREIFQEISNQAVRQKKSFLTRLYWNQHFTQKLADFPNLDTQTANPVFADNYEQIFQPNDALFQAWATGQTGYPLIDASMRALVKTGFLNFRMRAMVASFLTYILHQPWQQGADFMFYHLLDADRAINYSQWQMQSGMVGVHPNRVYNPTKQIIDHDLDCRFIKKYVPELRQVDSELITQDPERVTNSLFDWPYLPPVVSFHQELTIAKATFQRLNRKAFWAVQSDPELKQKLSLSVRAAQRSKQQQLPETKEV